ncbi:hypothetical protein C2S52_007225 [Perilla frutescens var. hirtella]|nr:hypothetical protein C2S52_007225 [Perilla frutescens var. hirtella]
MSGRFFPYLEDSESQILYLPCPSYADIATFLVEPSILLEASIAFCSCSFLRRLGCIAPAVAGISFPCAESPSFSFQSLWVVVGTITNFSFSFCWNGGRFLPGSRESFPLRSCCPSWYHWHPCALQK